MKNSAKRSVNRQLDFENEAVENQTKVILKSECYKLPRQGILSIKRCVCGGGGLAIFLGCKYLSSSAKATEVFFRASICGFSYGHRHD